MNNLVYTLRPSYENDLKFLLNSWSISHWHKNTYHKKCSPFNSYREMMNKRIIDIIKSNAQVIIACDPDNLDNIYAYIVYNKIIKNPIIHWIYVKSEYRNKGLGKALIGKTGINPYLPIVITHISNTACEIMKTHKEQDKYQLAYLPYIFDELRELYK
jgi:GNAT superfamily N-acetyltransferase